MARSYTDFLEAKTPVPVEHGTPVDAGDVHPLLFPHQRAIVQSQGGTCPRCDSPRANDGHCSVCFLRGLPR